SSSPSSYIVLSYFALCYSSPFFFSSFCVLSPSPIYPLSLHDALPIFFVSPALGFALGSLLTLIVAWLFRSSSPLRVDNWFRNSQDRKSTRLNSSHGSISYAVFCLKKKKIH